MRRVTLTAACAGLRHELRDNGIIDQCGRPAVQGHEMFFAEPRHQYDPFSRSRLDLGPPRNALWSPAAAMGLLHAQPVSVFSVSRSRSLRASVLFPTARSGPVLSPSAASSLQERHATSAGSGLARCRSVRRYEFRPATATGGSGGAHAHERRSPRRVHSSADALGGPISISREPAISAANPARFDHAVESRSESCDHRSGTTRSRCRRAHRARRNSLQVSYRCRAP